MDKEIIYEHAEIGDAVFFRDPDGTWRYADSWIAVPGARDVTLTDRFEPKLVVSASGEIERVVVNGADIASAPELLDWCRHAGAPIWKGAELVEVLVPFEEWQEHDRVPGALFSPEHEGTEPERQLAAAERVYREAELNLERAADHRADVLRLYADEMTRQEARRLTGLSVGRIQQLIRAERLDEHELAILGLFESGPIKTFQGFVRMAHRHELLQADKDDLRSAVDDLQSRGFLQKDDELGVGLTDEGTQLLLASRVSDRPEA
jgi:hypothetical protein